MTPSVFAQLGRVAKLNQPLTKRFAEEAHPLETVTRVTAIKIIS